MTAPTSSHESHQPELAESDPIALLKVILDEDRLAILGLAAQRPRTLADLTEALPGRRTPLAKHIAQLCAEGLLAVDGDRYVLDVRNLQTMKRVLFARPSAPVAEGSDEQVLATFVRTGKMIQYPAQQTKRMVLLRWLAAQFQEGQTYSEPEVNELLDGHSEDYATLRRFLVDAGLLERHNSIYRLPIQDRAGEGS